MNKQLCALRLVEDERGKVRLDGVAVCLVHLRPHIATARKDPFPQLYRGELANLFHSRQYTMRANLTTNAPAPPETL